MGFPWLIILDLSLAPPTFLLLPISHILCSKNTHLLVVPRKCSIFSCLHAFMCTSPSVHSASFPEVSLNYFPSLPSYPVVLLPLRNWADLWGLGSLAMSTLHLFNLLLNELCVSAWYIIEEWKDYLCQKDIKEVSLNRWNLNWSWNSDNRSEERSL